MSLLDFSQCIWSCIFTGPKNTRPSPFYIKEKEPLQVFIEQTVYVDCLTLFIAGEGRGGGEFYPLWEKFEITQDLAEIFSEPNLVLNLSKFQPYTMFGWRVMSILSSMTDLDFFQWKNECICVYMQKFNFTLLHILCSLYYIENSSMSLSIYSLIFKMSCDVI